MVFYRFSRHTVVVCSYMPPIWLFCICWGKVEMGWPIPKSSASKAFFLKSKVATGWRILLVGVNILFGVRILNKWRDLEAKKVYYSLPQIGGLNRKTNLFYHYTEKLEILWCVYVVSRDVISHVMYICFMASHSLWCEFGWFNPALSVALAKFAFVSRDGAKSGEKRFVFLS